MGKGNAPSAPDPYQSAQAQYDYGTRAANYNKTLNSTNVQGPTGSTSYQITGYDPGTHAPQYTQTNTLSAPEQQLLSGQQNLGLANQGAAAGALSNYQTAVQNNPIPSTGDLQNFGQKAQQAAYGAATADMDPHWNQQQEQMDASLRNSGAQPGTPAYDNAMQSFQADRSSAYGQAENQAFGQGLSAENQAFGQAVQGQQVPLSAYSSLMSGNQPVNTAPAGGGPGTGSVSSPDIMGAMNTAYQGQLAGYNANVASSNATTGDLTSLAALYLMS